MAVVDITTEILIDCPREQVATYASNPENAPSWYVNIESVEWKTSPPAVVGSQIAFVAHFLGRRLEYTYKIVKFVPGEVLVMRTAEGPFPMETRYTWDAITPSQTSMTLRNSGQPSGFSAFMAPLMSLMMRRANRKDLSGLKKILEERS